MKPKLFILLLLLSGCSNKERIGHYSLMRLNYGSLVNAADFIYKDQQSVVEYGQVALFETEPPKYREANQGDKLKALELCSNMELLKTFLNEAVTNCAELSKLYKGKNIFNSSKRQPEIDLYKKLLNNDDSSILKVTGGVKPEVYFAPYIPKGIKEMLMPFKIE